MKNYVYEQGLGIYVGKFSLEDINNQLDRQKVEEIKKATGFKYTNQKLIKENGEYKYIKIWVCSVEDFR